MALVLFVDFSKLCPRHILLFFLCGFRIFDRYVGFLRAKFLVGLVAAKISKFMIGVCLGIMGTVNEIVVLDLLCL